MICPREKNVRGMTSSVTRRSETVDVALIRATTYRMEGRWLTATFLSGPIGLITAGGVMRVYEGIKGTSVPVRLGLTFYKFKIHESETAGSGDVHT